MKTKSQMIREALVAGDHVKALRTAAKFFDGSADTLTFKRGVDALNHADFYRQLGQDPQQLVIAAIKLLQARFR